MPIKPENAARYPKDWKAIRARILERAGHKCDGCGIPNYAFRAKGAAGWSADADAALDMSETGEVTRIVLTIGHLDHTPEHCTDENLRAWCQRCHLAYDHEHHQQNARATRRNRKACGDLFA